MGQPLGAPAEPPHASGLRNYLDALAAGAPAPGGGSAAALTGAMSAALVAMVANFTVGRPKYAGVEAPVQAALASAERSRAELVRLMMEDERAYEAVAAARRLHRPDERRRRAIQDATRAAVGPPLRMAAISRGLLDQARVAAAHGNPNLASDAGVAALLAEAALRASAINVRVNLAALRDDAFVAPTEAQLDDLLRGTPALTEEVLALAGRRMVGG